MEITIKYPVTTEQICSLFVSAFEGGINYWSHNVDLIEGKDDPENPLIWWGQDEFWANPFQIELTYDSDEEPEGNGSLKKIITNADVERGLQIMASKASRHFLNIVMDNADAETADVMVQCIVFADREQPLVFG